jgi:hypothetical protein
MPDKPRSLGESPTHIRVSENFDTPGDRKGILSAIERILNLGGVQKLILELGKPIRVTRLVRKDEMPEAPQELVDDDIYAAARNAEMENLVPKALPGKDRIGAYETLFCAFDTLARRRLKPKALLVHKYSELQAWLTVDAQHDVSEIFGIDVRPHKEIPDNVALLVATRWDDTDTVVFSLRLEIDSIKRKT